MLISIYIYIHTFINTYICTYMHIYIYVHTVHILKCVPLRTEDDARPVGCQQLHPSCGRYSQKSVHTVAKLCTVTVYRRLRMSAYYMYYVKSLYTEF
jgi:hypothetical protein